LTLLIGNKYDDDDGAATTAERFFRIDQAQEHLHYATDIFSEELFIVYPEVNTEDEAATSYLSVPQDQSWTHSDNDDPPTGITSLLAGFSDNSEHVPLYRVSAKRNSAALKSTQ